MTLLSRLRQIQQFLVGVRDNPNEDPAVRAKAQEIIALFQPPSLAVLQNAFSKGGTNQKLAALGSLQSAIIRGALEE